MNYKCQACNWLSIFLCLIAFILLIFTWTSLFNVAYNSISPPQNSGLEISTKIVAVNYSISLIRGFIASIAILMLALFLFGWKKKYSSPSYWINCIALSIMIPHLLLWIFFILPF